MPPEHVPDGAIVITPKEFYDGVRADIGEIKDAVGALRGIPPRLDKLEMRYEELDRRIDLIDRKILWFAGLMAGAGSTLGTLAAQMLSR